MPLSEGLLSSLMNSVILKGKKAITKLPAELKHLPSIKRLLKLAATINTAPLTELGDTQVKRWWQAATKVFTTIYEDHADTSTVTAAMKAALVVAGKEQQLWMPAQKHGEQEQQDQHKARKLPDEEKKKPEDDKEKDEELTDEEKKEKHARRRSSHRARASRISSRLGKLREKLQSMLGEPEQAAEHRLHRLDTICDGILPPNLQQSSQSWFRRMADGLLNMTNSKARTAMAMGMVIKNLNAYLASIIINQVHDAIVSGQDVS